MIERQRAFAGMLHEIVGIRGRASQTNGEAPEPWVEMHQGAAHGFVDHSFSISDRMPS
jgi:hypothetical protein